MKNFFTLLLLLSFFSYYQTVMSQVTIGAGDAPNDFSLLELSTLNTKGGLRLPQIYTQTEKDELVSKITGNPEGGKGLVIYNMSNGVVEYWNGTGWIGLASSPWMTLDYGGIEVAKKNTDNIYQLGKVSIGTNVKEPSAVLNVNSSNQGVLFPRVALTGSKDIITIPNPVTGLFAYNTGQNASFPIKGYVYWDGTEWIIFESSITTVPEIESLVCGEATLDPQLLKAGQPYAGILKIPYTGGNGGKYSSGPDILSVGNTGLKAKLKADRLDSGFGYLVYEVTGTPRFNSPTGASFNISFGTQTIKSCTVTVGTEIYSDIKTRATMGELQKTAENGVSGYHRAITTPDGKYSVRVFVPDGIILANADIQIRSNLIPRTIMWNGHVSYQNGTMGTASNQLALSTANMWYGNNGANSDTAVPISSNVNAAWGNADVYYFAPEQRSYMWTSTQIVEKTMYVFSFMMGAPNSALVANDANALQTKAYLEIRQIRTLD